MFIDNLTIAGIFRINFLQVYSGDSIPDSLISILSPIIPIAPLPLTDDLFNRVLSSIMPNCQ